MVYGLIRKFLTAAFIVWPLTIGSIIGITSSLLIFFLYDYPSSSWSESVFRWAFSPDAMLQSFVWLFVVIVITNILGKKDSDPDKILWGLFKYSSSGFLGFSFIAIGTYGGFVASSFILGAFDPRMWKLAYATSVVFVMLIAVFWFAMFMIVDTLKIKDEYKKIFDSSGIAIISAASILLLLICYYCY